MSRIRFILALAWREGRASGRRGLLLIAAVAIGVAALVAINSFTDNLGDSVRVQARALLGADLVVSSYRAFSDETEAILQELGAPLSLEEMRGTAPPAEPPTAPEGLRMI